MELFERILIFASASPNLILDEAVSRNAHDLALNGILYPHELDVKVHFPGLWVQGDIFRAVTGVEGVCSLEEQIQKIRSQCRASQSKITTLLLSLGGAALHIEAMRAIQHALSSFFNTPVSFFFAYNRQDIVIENDIAWSSLHGRQVRQVQQVPQAVDYKQHIEELYQAFGRENVTLYFLEDNAGDRENVQKALFYSLGFTGSQLASSGIQISQPRYTLRIPPPFWAFCGIANSLGSERCFRGYWLQEAARYAAQFASWDTEPVLLDYEKRLEALRGVEESNAALAASLGKSCLFQPPEQDGRPLFTGLTIETAFKVAGRLDRDFAAARMAEFDAAPIQHMTREQRLCRRALHDALAPPSATPLPHRGLPPRLSVLTLAYNHASYIAECMEGVIAQQTDFPIQHIIADDASDDGTQDIILDYAARYPHIVPVFQKTRSRGPENVRALFNAARTEYVALCDGDDYFTDPAKLQTQVDLLDAHKDYALCFHVVRVVHEDGSRPERLYPPEEILPCGVRSFYYLVDLIRNNFIQTNSVMYRWRFSGGLPDWFRADITPSDRYWHLLHAQMGKIGFINKVMSVYRRHEKSVFYLSEIDALKHRANFGLREIKVWDAINRHFKQKYESIILDMISHIFADCLLYDTRQEEEGIIEEPMLHKLSDKYPDFAWHFLASLQKISAKD